MGTRIELHRFGPGDADALAVARRVIEAVDDALTIHRPSSVTALNEQLMAGRAAAVDNPLLFDALVEVEAAHALTDGLFDPAAERGVAGGGWQAIRFDRDRARVEASRPVALDFGGLGKGFALDRAEDVLREAGVASAFLSAGESSVAVIGGHPLGGAWPVAVPHPFDPGRMLVELELQDEAMSVSATVGGGSAAAERAATIRPGDGAIVLAPRTAVAVERSGACAEAMSTALLVASEALICRLSEAQGARRFLFTYPGDVVPGKRLAGTIG
jgi:thiamine biosynthesis lipoprotein